MRPPSKVMVKSITKNIFDLFRVILFVIFYFLHSISEGILLIIEFVLSILMKIANL